MEDRVLTHTVEFKLDEPIHVQGTKLFYKKYPYKIVISKKLSTRSIPSIPWQRRSSDEAIFRSITENNFYKTKQLVREDATSDIFKDKVRVREEMDMSVFFANKEDYDLGVKRYGIAIKEVTEPFREDLTQLVGGLNKRVEIRKSLYFKEYKYRVDFTIPYSYGTSAGGKKDALYKELSRFFKDDPVGQRAGMNSLLEWYMKHGNRYYHSTYSMLFNDESDVAYVAFMLDEKIKIKAIKEAVLMKDFE
jgi:hypothetical protein